MKKQHVKYPVLMRLRKSCFYLESDHDESLIVLFSGPRTGMVVEDTANIHGQGHYSEDWAHATKSKQWKIYNGTLHMRNEDVEA